MIEQGAFWTCLLKVGNYLLSRALFGCLGGAFMCVQLASERVAWEVSGVGKFEEKEKKRAERVRGAGDGRRSIGTVSARWS